MTRDIAIGDIHGCDQELLDLLEAAGATERDRIISVGDVVDRGPGPVELGDSLDTPRKRLDA